MSLPKDAIQLGQQEGYELVPNKEQHGTPLNIIMSDKMPLEEHGDPHWTGQLLPPAIPRPDDRAHEFFDGSNVLG